MNFGALLSKITNQPESYCKRTKYTLGKTLGAGTFGVVREAIADDDRYAVKIILKKNVRGHEDIVYDELDLLQRMNHPHIIKFVDWFESKV